MSLLSIRDLRVSFASSSGTVRANDAIDLDIEEGEIVAVVGETGSGKSILGRAIVHLVSGSVSHTGSIRYRDMEVLGIPEVEMTSFRGKEIALVLQDPSSSLDPTMRCLDQVAESMVYGGGTSWHEARRKALALLDEMGIPASRARDHPHLMSGGMRQRVAIAVGLALSPSLLIVDEPTKGLDGDSWERVVDEMVSSVRGRGASMMVITHDLRLARDHTDRVAVMYAGELVEVGPSRETLSAPRHPYTRDLVAALPENGMRAVPGDSPPLSSLPGGCRYHPRCRHRVDGCEREHPHMTRMGGSSVRCLLCEGGR